MKKVFLAGLLLIAMTALFGCGGGGGTAGVQTAVGRFVDAPVAGLSYVSGSQKGVTGADGSFTYEVGKPVKFSIGDIVLGEAPATAQMTPIDLSATAGANATTPDVLARVQLLMSLSSTNPADGTITIPPATLTAAQGKIMNFASTTTQAELQAIVSALAPAKPLVTTDQATAHFKGTLDKIFITSMIAGKTFNYTNSNGNSGWITINTDGTMKGIQNFGDVGTTDAKWSIDSSGKLLMTVLPSNKLNVITLISQTSTSIIASDASVDGTFTITLTPSTSPIIPIFTTAMIAGRTVTTTYTDGPKAMLFSATGNTVTYNGISGTWTINKDGTLTVKFPIDSITTTIVSGSGNTFTVTTTHAATPATVEGPDTMTIK